MKDPLTRFSIIDALKALASQLIVWHHLAAYGPLSDAVYTVAPQLIAWLYDNVRMAVQVFIVIGGYLSARSLFPGGERFSGSLPMVMTNRYLRLAIPYVAALLLAMFSAAIARQWLTDDFVPDVPSWTQVLAHMLLLHGVLEYGALSAGVWYIAVDFQLFLLMVTLLWLGRRMDILARLSKYFIPLPVTVLAALSLFWFNRHPEYDDWAPYFFGAYGLGAAVYWAQHDRRNRPWLWLMALMVVMALLVEFRPRLALALLVAVLLWVARRSRRIERWASVHLSNYLGRISYSLFLVHFPVLLLTNALFTHLGLHGAVAGSLGMVTTWGMSIACAAWFYRHVEAPAMAIKVQHLGQYLRRK